MIILSLMGSCVGKCVVEHTYQHRSYLNLQEAPICGNLIRKLKVPFLATLELVHYELHRLSRVMSSLLSVLLTAAPFRCTSTSSFVGRMKPLCQKALLGHVYVAYGVGETNVTVHKSSTRLGLPKVSICGQEDEQEVVRQHDWSKGYVLPLPLKLHTCIGLSTILTSWP